MTPDPVDPPGLQEASYSPHHGWLRMKLFAARRLRNAVLTLSALALVAAWVRAQHRDLESTSFTTGYLLLATIGFLALYNIRKKLPMLPLGSSTAWLQWHIYIGMGSLGIFAMHAGASLPHGILDTTLAAVYLLTITSGVVGLVLTRTIPAQLTRVGEEVIYERIPAYRQQVRRKAHDLVLESVAASGATTLADFYTAKLIDYFDEPRSWAYQLRPTTTRRRALMREMHDIRRYLSDQEQGFCEKLFSLVRKKDDLDFQAARQQSLKLWLFVHIGLTCCLLVLATLHAILVHAFHGGGV